MLTIKVYIKALWCVCVCIYYASTRQNHVFPPWASGMDAWSRMWHKCRNHIYHDALKYYSHSSGTNCFHRYLLSDWCSHVLACHLENRDGPGNKATPDLCFTQPVSEGAISVYLCQCANRMVIQSWDQIASWHRGVRYWVSWLSAQAEVKWICANSFCTHWLCLALIWPGHDPPPSRLP